MKSSVLRSFALVCLALAAFAQTNVDSYRKAGAAYFKAGQFRESVKAYQQVIRLAPNDADAYEQLAEGFSKLGMNSEAAEAYEKLADLLTAGQPAPPPVAVQNTTPRTQLQPAAANGQHRFKAGQRVEFIEASKWFKAVVLEVASAEDTANSGPYHVYLVHPLGFDVFANTWVGDFTDNRLQVRPVGSGPTEPVNGGEANDEVLKAMGGATAKVGPPPARTYNCGGASPPIIITGNSTYNGGTYSFDPASATLTFRGGSYGGQRAIYELSFGASRLHLLGPRGDRAVQCD